MKFNIVFLRGFKEVGRGTFQFDGKAMQADPLLPGVLSDSSAAHQANVWAVEIEHVINRNFGLRAHVTPAKE